MADEPPAKLEAIAVAFAGAAFGIGALLVRRATLVPAGMFDGAAVALFAWGASIALHRAAGHAAAILLRGAGFAVAALLAAAALAPPYDRAGLPAAAWLLGGAALQASTRAGAWRLGLAAGGSALLLLGAGIGWSAAEVWPETARLRWALSVASVLAFAGLLARMPLARRWPRGTPAPVGVLLVAALAATYVAYRPLVAASVANLPLYEWTLGVGAAGLMLGRLRASARDAAVNEAWSGEGRRHEQAAAPAYDARMAPLAVAIQRYLDTGDGFEDYRSALLRVAPHAPPTFRKTLQGAQPVQGRGRAAKAARRERLVTHDAILELLR